LKRAIIVLLGIVFFTVYALYADPVSDVARSFLSEVVAEVPTIYNNETFHTPAVLGTLSGTWLFCINASQMILDHRDLNKADTNLWTRNVADYKRMLEHIEKIRDSELEYTLRTQGFDNAQRFNQIYNQNMREAGDILLNRFFARLDLLRPR
jgi:hypothetical protein